MDFSDSTARYAACVSIVALLAAFLLMQPTGLVKWLQKKNYQYEVTMPLYMLTPTEKFVINSIIFLTISMLLIASFLYLPDHVMTMSRRTYYYFAGDATHSTAKQAAGALQETATKAGEAALAAASDLAETAYTAVVNKTADAAHAAASEVVEAAGV